MRECRYGAETRWPRFWDSSPGQLETGLSAHGPIPAAPRDLLRRRPDVRQVEHVAAAESALISASKANLYPAFSLGGSLSFGSTDIANRDLGDAFTWDNRLASIGPAFQWNLFNYGQITNQVRAQDAQFQAAMLAYQNTVLQAQREVEDALVAFVKADDTVRYLERAVATAKRSEELSVDQHKEGATDFTTVLIAEQNRLRDMARTELGAQTYSHFFRLDTKQAAGIAVFQLPGANALDVAREGTGKMAELAGNFPQGLEYRIPFDTTLFVKASIHEVYMTLFEAAILVLIVILLFVQDWRATLVPATTVPVTIIGAFAAMSELFGPIIGITLMLMSVFLPAAFLPGITGEMYRQFALVIAATALISAINALTLKPTQCALWMRPIRTQKNFIYRGFNTLYGALERAYTRLIGRMVQRSAAMTLIALSLSATGIWGLARLPISFIPIEDQGYALVNVKLPDGASLERTREVLAQIEAAVMKVPGVAHAISIGGISVLDNSATLANAGVTYVVLKPWDVRGTREGLRPVLEHIQNALTGISDAVAFVIIPPPIQGIGNSSGFQMQVELRDNTKDYVKLQRVTEAISADAATQSGIQHVLSTFSAGVPQLMVEVDRVKARQLDVDVNDVFTTLQGYLGSTYVNQFNKFGRTLQVYDQADSRYRLEPVDIVRFYVRNASGDMVPIGTLADIQYVPGLSRIGLYNLHPSAAIIGIPDRLFSTGQAIALLAEIADQKLPSGMGYEWTAMSYQENLVGSQAYFIFVIALVLVYIVLAGQYENWIAPLAVIFAVPLALLGTVCVLNALHVANNIYLQIGIVLLIALSSKNAILIVEYARDLHEQQGMALAAAATEAARLRFRPILMTSFAFILGVLPLVLASGAGASSRKSIGITVFSGMLASTCIAVLFVPSFFVICQRIHEWRRQHKTDAAAQHSPAQEQRRNPAG